MKASSDRQYARLRQRTPSDPVFCGAIQRQRSSALDKDWHFTSIASEHRFATMTAHSLGYQ